MHDDERARVLAASAHDLATALDALVVLAAGPTAAGPWIERLRSDLATRRASMTQVVDALARHALLLRSQRQPAGQPGSPAR